MQGSDWNKEEIVDILRPFFLLGYNVSKACELAEFPRSTFATWLKEDEVLRRKVSAWRSSISTNARRAIAEKIIAGDTNDAKWWLERKERKDFGAKTEVDLSVTHNLQTIEKTLIDIANGNPTIQPAAIGPSEEISSDSLQGREGGSDSIDASPSDSVLADLHKILAENQSDGSHEVRKESRGGSGSTD